MSQDIYNHEKHKTRERGLFFRVFGVVLSRCLMCGFGAHGTAWRSGADLLSWRHLERMLDRDFSHVSDFTGYMAVVFGIIQEQAGHQKILDVPAGKGLLASRLREAGHEVTCADINRERADYVYADLNEPLPFQDAAFDTCICTEGIEHVLDPAALIRELCRVTRPGGQIILSLPNIQNAYSRLSFMCTGCFYQFSPGMSRHLGQGEQIDRGHISPMNYLQLRYLFEHNGAQLVGLAGDRWKKKWLVPFLFPFFALGWIWGRQELGSHPEAPRTECVEKLRHLHSPTVLLSRSLILTFARN